MEDLVVSANEFIKLLEKEDYVAAVSMFDTVMKGVMPELVLEQTWKQVLAQTGDLVGQTGTATVQHEQFEIVFVTCEFEKLSLNIRVVFNEDKQVTGLGFEPPGKTT